MSNIHGPNNNTSSSNIGIVLSRPTEAQLRWAQFRRKSSCNQSMEDKVRNLYPENPCDVPGALSDDGETSQSNSDDETNVRPRGISKGRRAMLRVSQRRYMQRRREIDLYGFQHTTTNENERSNTSSSVIVDDEDDDDNASVGNSFIVDPDGNITVANRRRKRRDSEKSERFRRFEMAFQVALDSIAANNNTLILADDEAEEEEINKNGRRGARKSSKPPRTSLHNPAPPPPPPIDRGASWLQHLPTPIKQNHSPLKRSPLERKRPTSSTNWSPDIETSTPDFYKNLHRAMQTQQSQLQSSYCAAGNDESFTSYNPHHSIAQAITYDSEDEKEMNDDKEDRRRSMVFQRLLNDVPPFNLHQPSGVLTDCQIIAATVSEDVEVANDYENVHYRHPVEKKSAAPLPNNSTQQKPTSSLFHLSVSPREHSLAVNAILSDLTPPPPTQTYMTNAKPNQMNEEQMRALLFLSPTQIPNKTRNKESNDDDDPHTMNDPRVSITSTIVEVGGNVELVYEYSEGDKNDRVDEHLSTQIENKNKMFLDVEREKESFQKASAILDDRLHDPVEMAHFTKSTNSTDGEEDNGTTSQAVINPFLDESSSFAVTSPLTPKSDVHEDIVVARTTRVLDGSEISDVPATTCTGNWVLSSKATDTINDDTRIGRQMDHDAIDNPFLDESSSVTEATSTHHANHHITEASPEKSAHSSNARNTDSLPTLDDIIRDNQTIDQVRIPGESVILSSGRNTGSSQSLKAMDSATSNGDTLSTSFVTEKDDGRVCSYKDSGIIVNETSFSENEQISDCDKSSSEKKNDQPTKTTKTENLTNLELKNDCCLVASQSSASFPKNVSVDQSFDNYVHLGKRDQQVVDADALAESTNIMPLAINESQIKMQESRKSNSVADQNDNMNASLLNGANILNPPGHRFDIGFSDPSNAHLDGGKEILKETSISDCQTMSLNKSNPGQKGMSSLDRLGSVVASRKRVTFRAVALKSAEIVFDRLGEKNMKKVGDGPNEGATSGKDLAGSFVDDSRQKSDSLRENRSKCTATDAATAVAIDKEIIGNHGDRNSPLNETVYPQETKLADGWSFDLADDQPQSPEQNVLGSCRTSPLSCVVSARKIAPSLTDNYCSYRNSLQFHQELCDVDADEVTAKDDEASAESPGVKYPVTSGFHQQHSIKSIESPASSMKSTFPPRSSTERLRNLSDDVVSPSWPDLSSISLEVPDQSKRSIVPKDSYGSDLSVSEPATRQNDKPNQLQEVVIDFLVDKLQTHETDLPVKSATDMLIICPSDQINATPAMDVKGSCVQTKTDRRTSNDNCISLHGSREDHATSALHPSAFDRTAAICATSPLEEGISIQLGDESATNHLTGVPVITLPSHLFRDINEDFPAREVDDSLHCIVKSPKQVLPDMQTSKIYNDENISSDYSEDPFASVLLGNDFSRISNMPSEIRSSTSFTSTDHDKSNPLLALFSLMTLEPQLSDESCQCEDILLPTETGAIAPASENGSISENGDFCVESSTLECSSIVRETIHVDKTLSRIPIFEISRLEWNLDDTENTQVPLDESMWSNSNHCFDPKTKRSLNNGCGMRSREDITRLFFRNDVEYDVQWERRLLL